MLFSLLYNNYSTYYPTSHELKYCLPRVPLYTSCNNMFPVVTLYYWYLYSINMNVHAYIIHDTLWDQSPNVTEKGCEGYRLTEENIGHIRIKNLYYGVRNKKGWNKGVFTQIVTLAQIYDKHIPCLNFSPTVKTFCGTLFRRREDGRGCGLLNYLLLLKFQRYMVIININKMLKMWSNNENIGFNSQETVSIEDRTWLYCQTLSGASWRTTHGSRFAFTSN